MFLMIVIQKYLIAMGLPLTLIVPAALTIDWLGRITGSTTMPQAIAVAQSSSPKVVYFNEQIPTWGAYKVARASQVKPDVVYIGSSRGNSFRDRMFAHYKFYNAALTAWTIDQTRVMLGQLLGVCSPKVVVISIDYWMFADQWTGIEKTRSMQFDWWLLHKFRSDRAFLRTLANHPSLLLSKILPILNGSSEGMRDGLTFLGIDGILNEVGFRPDGSFLQPAHYKALARDNDKRFMGTVVDAFPGGRRYDQKQADQLERLARFAKSQGIQLIAVQLPLAPSATQYLDTEKSYNRDAGLWRESHTDERRDMLQQLGIPFFDLARLLDDNTDFQDAAHPTEKAMLKILLKLNSETEFHAALPMLDSDKLKADLAGVDDPEAVVVYATY
jgi:hypothetical protein